MMSRNMKNGHGRKCTGPKKWSQACGTYMTGDVCLALWKSDIESITSSKYLNPLMLMLVDLVVIIYT